MIRFIVLLVVIYSTFRIGTIWDSQANPVRNATVYLQSEMTLKGSLSYTWTGDQALEDDSGNVYILSSSSIKYSSYPVNLNDSFWLHWRALLPIFVVLFFWMLVVLPYEIIELRNSLRRSKPNVSNCQSGN